MDGQAGCLGLGRQSLGQIHLITKLLAVLVLACSAWLCICIVVPPVKTAGMAVITELSSNMAGSLLEVRHSMMDLGWLDLASVHLPNNSVQLP